MTARQLARRLAAAGVRFDYRAGVIRVIGPFPDELARDAKTLKTGLAALAAGRRWYALAASGRPMVLDPGELVPADAKYLGVGDARAGWDYIRPAARRDLPHLFAAVLRERL